MTCQEFVELVTAYLEGSLTNGDTVAFEEHMDLCPGCEIYLQQFRQTIDILGGLQEESVSPAARRRLLAVFAHWHTQPSPGAR